MNKQRWLDWAELFDSWRVVPRAFLGIYWTLTFKYVFMATNWYMHLPANERGYEETGFLGATVGLLIKFGKDVYDTYAQNGRDWNAAPKVDP